MSKIRKAEMARLIERYPEAPAETDLNGDDSEKLADIAL